MSKELQSLREREKVLVMQVNNSSTGFFWVFLTVFFCQLFFVREHLLMSFLYLQAERSPGSQNNRPATLELEDKAYGSNNSSPKSPQPLEFEVRSLQAHHGQTTL